MNLAQNFTAARVVAQHCAELTKSGPRPEERAEHLASWRRDVAREVAQDLADLLSGSKLTVQVSEPEMMPGETVFERIGVVAANSLLRCGSAEQTLLLSFTINTAIALTDRSFGGSGEAVREDFAALPRSAALLVEQAARSIAQAIARVSAGGGALGEVEGDVIVRSESATRLKPFEPSEQCAFLTLTITAPDGNSWSAHLAMPTQRLDSLLPGLNGSQGAAPSSVDTELAENAAFASIPLPLEAVLAEFDLSLSKLERLAPGDSIPLSIARDIPLRVGHKVLATGRLGTMEDRMALRLNAISGASSFTEGGHP